MKINRDKVNNAVCAEGQVNEKFQIFEGAKGAPRVLFLGNSITLHERLDREIEQICRQEGYEFVTLADLGYDGMNKALGQFENEAVSLHPNDFGMTKIAERILEKL